MVYPPRYGNISIPAVVAGNILQSDDTSVSVTDVGFDGHIVMKTQNTIAMIVNQDQSVSIGTEQITSQLTVNNSSTTKPTLRLSYQNSYFLDTNISAFGNITTTPSCDDLLLNPDLTVSFKKNFNVADHDGSTRGLRLAGTLVTATASKLNYTDVVPGVATVSKAVVLDSNKSISGVNVLSASTLSGVLTAGPQLGITEIDTLNIRTQLSISGTPFTLSPTQWGYLNVNTLGVAQANTALVVNASRNITNIGNLSASTLSGVLTIGAQPNITSLPGLNNLSVTGVATFGTQIVVTQGPDSALRLRYDVNQYADMTVSSTGELSLTSTGGLVSVDSVTNFRIRSHNGSSSGLILGSQLVVATGVQLNYTAVDVGVATAGRALVLDGSKNIYGINILGAVQLEGRLTTASQPNITSVTTLNITAHNGNTTGLSLAGVLVTSTAAKLNYVDTTPGSAQASKSLVVDSGRSITNINSITASTITGTLMTNDQPNITTVQTLRVMGHDNSSQGLMLGSVLVTASATQLNFVRVIEGVATASRAMVLDVNKSITGVTSLSATTLVGTLSTTTQPNINVVNTLNIQQHNGTTQGLSLGGALVTTTAAQINRLNTTPGIATPDRVMILDGSASIVGLGTLGANSLSGLVVSPVQTSIRTMRSINIDDHDGATTGLSLAGTLVVSTGEQLNTLAVNRGTAAASKAMVLDSAKSITGVNTLDAANLYGLVRTPNQQHITSVATLNITSHDGSTQGLSLAGTLIEVSGDQINKLKVTDGSAAASKALVLNSSSSISGINSLSAASITGTLITASQPNINSVNTLNVVSHNGSSTGLSLGGTLITATATEINRIDTNPGFASAGKVVILDTDLNYSGINTLSATTLSGSLSTAYQPGITSVNTLNITAHDGGSQGLKLNGTLVMATANQLNYLTVVPGAVSSGRALVVNDSNSLSGVNQLSVNKLIANQLSLTGVVSNFNTNGVIIKTYSMTNLVGRVVDVQLLTNLTFQNFQPNNMTNSFSSEIIGYIRPDYSELYTFYVNCTDRVRMWVNDVLVLHSWVSLINYRTTTSLFLNAGQWVKIYIQYQVDAVSTSFLNVQWASTSTARANIPSSALAWDSNQPANDSNHFTQNTLTIYNSSTAALNATTMTVDTSGDLIIDASGNDITLGSADNFNIPSHNGSTSGLSLGGVLVQPNAYEINYLKVSPGQVTASKALVVDASKSLLGLNTLTATSMSCTNLTTSNFTISDLTLSGPLNNYNTGSLLIRQFSGPDMTGRVINVGTITDINLSNYDPEGLTTNYSLDIIGYVKPTFTEPYTFFAIANDRVRIWINNVLVLNVWDTNTGLEYTSTPIQLTANQWTPIYIQYQNISDSGTLIVRWSSTTLNKSFIPVNNMAWDNTVVRVPQPITIADSITMFSSQSGLTNVRSGQVSVDTAGNLSLASSAGTVSIAANNNLNIVSHNGTSGLQLAGSLVTATANELNRIGGVTPGTTLAGKAVVLDSSKAVSGLTTITCDELFSVIRTPAQPFITSFGTLAGTLTSTSDILIGATTRLRLLANSTTSIITSSSATTTDSAADLFVGNYGTDPSTSSRKFMLKASGALGIQTNTPNRTLSINAAGATYGMRLINNNAVGGETNFTDLGTDSSGVLTIAPSGTTTRALSNLIIGKTSASTMTVSAGVLNISSDSGCVQIGNSTNTVIPLEVGSASFTLTGSVGFLNNTGAVGSFSSAPSTYSIRTTSSIIVNGTVCVTSDRRLKERIVDLDVARCRKFIMDSNPVSFRYKTDRTKQRLGLIAQDVAQTDFKELVQFTPDSIDASTDNGFVSPANASMNVSYTEIIPILMATVKDLYQKNAELQTKLEHLYSIQASND